MGYHKKTVINHVLTKIQDKEVLPASVIAKNLAIESYVNVNFHALRKSGKATCIDLMVAALKCINSQGLIGLTLNDVARTSTFNNRSGAYRYFTSLEDLLKHTAKALRDGLLADTVVSATITNEEQFLMAYVVMRSQKSLINSFEKLITK
ncbi:MAG: hypothetical protein ACRCR2_02645 [Fusobacteriaceae bacterium]